MAGALIWISGAGSQDRGQVVTAADRAGRFSILHPGDLGFVSAKADGFAWCSREALDRGTAAAHPELTLVLREPSRLVRGMVLDQLGNPVENAWIGLVRGWKGASATADTTDSGTPVIEAATDCRGCFVAEGLGRGDWRIEAWKEGLAPALGRITIEDGDPEPVTFRLTSGRSLSGTVRDEAGIPVPRVVIVATGGGCFGRAGETASKPDGTYRLEHLPASRLSVSAGPLSGPRVTASIDWTHGEEATWDPVLSRQRAISGRVLDERGCARAFVQIRGRLDSSKDHWIAETVSDATGAFDLGDCPDRPFLLELEIGRWGPGGVFVMKDVRAPSESLEIRIPESARPSATISGRILDVGGATLIAAAVVVSRAEDPALVQTSGLSRAPDGAFRLGPIPAGSYVVEVGSKSGAKHLIDECTLEPDDEIDLGDRRLQREGFLKVCLKRDGSASATPRLTMVDRFDRKVMKLVPVADFAASGPLSPGRYRLQASGRSQAGSYPVEILAGGTSTVDVVVRDGE
jgi:hypothetical protein